MIVSQKQYTWGSYSPHYTPTSYEYISYLLLIYDRVMNSLR